MSSQTASRHEVSCCKHGGSYPLSCCQVSSWIGGFSSQVHRPPVCPSYWNSLAAYIASKRNLRAGRFPSHNASRKGGCFNAQSKKGVTKTGCCRHRPSRVGEEREVSRNMFRHTPARTHCSLDFFSAALQSHPRLGRRALWVRRGPWIKDNGRERHQCKRAADDETLVEFVGKQTIAKWTPL